jgi:hypothetical protein
MTTHIAGATTATCAIRRMAAMIAIDLVTTRAASGPYCLRMISAPGRL